MAGAYELKPTANGEFMFNLKAGNGQVILTSERYNAKAGALGGIESVRTNSPDDDRYERRVAKDDSPYFVLKAANGQIIGQSALYSGTQAMENGIASVKTNGPGATIDDQT
ncbi:MAG: YegP family protein [Planctomycetaceae bacterium]|nr:YegP family protein [Planctomycetaceae bacterium]